MQERAHIFLSYRRDDTRYVAGRLSDRLAQRFDGHEVFVDVVSIEPGEDFGEAVERAIESCDVLLALIGTTWMTSSNEHGRRLDDADDWVVLEISTALARGVPVVPVLIDGASAPRTEDLPEALAPLARRNAVRIDYETFDSDIGSLLDFLQGKLRDGASPPHDPGVPKAPGWHARLLYVSRVDRIVEPVRLGVHPAAAIATADELMDRTPPFVERDAFPALRAVLRNGRFVLIVGDSTAGKSRLAFEAMRRCLPTHFCVVPEQADALAGAIAETRSRRPAVLWLDDLERYLPRGGLSRTDVIQLLDDGEVVVLATIRAHEYDDYSPRYDLGREPGEKQAARAGREVLSLATEIRLERMWSARELAAAGERSDDSRIAQALTSADRYGLAEFIAAGPQLLGELRNAWSASPRPHGSGRVFGDPRGAALVTAAVDVRLAGYHKPVPLTTLRNLNEVYLTAHGGAVLRPGSWENALAWATHPLHATSSLLQPADGECYLAFDYLVDAAARDPEAPPIPDETWTALVDHVELTDAVEVAWHASFAGRPEHAVRVGERALADEQYVTAAEVATFLGTVGEARRAVELLERAIAGAEQSGTVSPENVLAMCQSLAWELGEKVGGHGDPERALEIARQVVDDSVEIRGQTHPETLSAQLTLARQLGGAGRPADALALAREVCAGATATMGTEDHPLVDSARFEVAVWTRRLEGAAAGVRKFGDLLDDLEARPSPNWYAIIDCAWNLGGSLVDAGRADQALPLLEAVVANACATFGEWNPHTFNYRLTHLQAVADTSGPRAAADRARQMVDDSTSNLGADHLTTLRVRHRAALWTAKAGETEAAARLLADVRDDAARVLGENHWLVEDSRGRLTQLTSWSALHARLRAIPALKRRASTPDAT